MLFPQDQKQGNNVLAYHSYETFTESPSQCKKARNKGKRGMKGGAEYEKEEIETI